MATPGICSVDGCSKRSNARELCNAHYAVERRKKDLPESNLVRWLRDHVDHPGRNPCLPWPFGRNDLGYGIVEYKGRNIIASRLMCIMAHGEPPTPEHEAAHSCGNGHEGCVHPAHLQWATSKQNHEDMIRHGTLLLGAANPAAKISGDQAAEIRSMKGLERQADTGKRYGISQAMVSNIQRRVNWC